MSKKSPLPEIETIISTLRANERQDLIVLIIPSHEKKGKSLQNQDQWANAALELFAELYGGATAFNTFAGIYRDVVEGTIHRDKPILLECYARKADLDDTTKQHRLGDFIKRMGKETRQAAVALIINNVFFEITQF